MNTVYLSNSKDTPKKMLGKLDVNDTASSNLHRIDFAEYYCEGVFEADAMLDKVQEILRAETKPDCSDCRWNTLCQTTVILDNREKKEGYVAAEQKAVYVMPEFTEDQMRVVEHVNGPMRVCAGPGSGKTATLIGRIRYLIEKKGIMPEFILVVTFTTEAADELRNRCLSFLPEKNLPKIATLHGFCYGILRENICYLEKGLKILSSSQKLNLIKAISSVMPPLSGFKYGKEYGNHSVYSTIADRLDYYFQCLNDSEFFYRYPDCDRDFLEFARQYQAAVKDGGYITFDEQITLCNRLFMEHPEVLKVYQNIYQYIMVDEYQDVNKAQVDMFYALAGHGNLVVVGDDDQGIYGFRGASSAFMIGFEKDFPTAESIVLRDNFRSTKALVDASKDLIRNNKNRIDKDIRSGRKDDYKDTLPVLVPSMEVPALERIISSLLGEGYSYGDIAVLSTKNAPLEQLHNALKVPTVLAKSYLRQDGFFLLLYSVLKLQQDMDNDRTFYQYLQLHGKAGLIQREKGMSLSQSVFSRYGLESLDDVGKGRLSAACPLSNELNYLYTYIEIVSCAESMEQMIDTIRIASNWDDSNACEVLEIFLIRKVCAE